MSSGRVRLRLSTDLAQAVLAQAGVAVDANLHITDMHSGNAVFRVRVRSGTFFLKIPTKDFESWPVPLEGAAARVARETAAYECLRSNGVPVPEVVASEPGVGNPLGRPYLVTRSLAGRPFTSIMPARAHQSWPGAFEAVGAFLAGVHAIEFNRAGFLTPDGPAPATPPERPRAEHDPETAQARAMRDLATVRASLTPGLVATLERRFSGLAVSLADEYIPPRFVIGACHPNHPFLEFGAGRWTVTGCIDLEVASAGSPFADLFTFASGIMLRPQSASAWWEPLFAGYGAEPFERFRTALLSECGYLFRQAVGTERLGAVYAALLSASSWRDLLSAHRTAMEAA